MLNINHTHKPPHTTQNTTMKTSVKMTLTEKEKEIQQLNLCIETTKIIARQDKSLSNLCRGKIRMYRALIKKLQKS